MIFYSPSSFFEKPLEEQIEERNYDDLTKSDTEPAKKHEEELGPGVSHALLATGSGEELKAVAYALQKFNSLHPYQIGTGSSSSADKPQKAILFGEIEPGVPMVAALQANYLYQQSDKGPPSSTDLFLCGLHCSGEWGLKPVNRYLIEFDFHSKYGSRRQTLKDRDKDRGEAIRGVQTGHVEKKEGYTDDWDKVWRKETNEHVKAFTQNASREIKERASEMASEGAFTRGALSELPIIPRFENVDRVEFRSDARAHCFESYSSITPENAGLDVFIRVTRYGINVEEVQPNLEDVKNAFFDELRGPIDLPSQLDTSEDDGEDNA